METTRVLPAALILVLAGWLPVSCGKDGDPPTAESSGSCAAAVSYAGHDYVGHGDLVRDPETTGRVEAGTATADDCGVNREVEVAELAEVPMDRAVLVEGTVYLRTDRPFPEAARTWFSLVRCATDGVFELSGHWLGVTSPNPTAFDGDLRPPFRVEVHVTDGPDAYIGAKVRIRATEDTDPTLGPTDVKDSLSEGGDLTAVVHCEDGTFVATALTSTPG